MNDLYILRLRLPFAQEFYNEFCPRALEAARDAASALNADKINLQQYLLYAALNYINECED